MAHVTSSGGNPTGTVTFYVNGQRVGVGALDTLTGIATVDVPFICQGDSVVKAVYSGDTFFFVSFGTAVHSVDCFMQ